MDHYCRFVIGHSLGRMGSNPVPLLGVLMCLISRCGTKLHTWPEKWRRPMPSWSRLRTALSLWNEPGKIGSRRCCQSITHYKSKWRSNIWIRDVFCYRIPAPLVPGVPTKTRLESSIKKFKPHATFVVVQAPWCRGCVGQSPSHTVQESGIIL